LREFNPAHVAVGSKPEITAAQHHCPLHLNKQISAALASERPKGQAMAYTGAVLRGSALDTPRNRCVRFVFGVTAASRNNRFQAAC
jgi:hypothetical protein